MGALGLLQRSLDADPPFVEVQVLPPKRPRLAAARSSAKQEGYNRAQCPAFEVAQGRADLLPGQDGNLSIRYGRRTDEGRDILPNDAPGCRSAKSAMQDPMDMTNRAGGKRPPFVAAGP